MFARVARYEVPEDRIDDAIENFRKAAAELEQLDGLEGGYVLVDRDNSTAITLTLWESRAALDASEVRASRVRQTAIGEAGGSVQAVDRGEVAYELGGS